MKKVLGSFVATALLASQAVVSFAAGSAASTPVADAAVTSPVTGVTSTWALLLGAAAVCFASAAVLSKREK